MASQGVQVGRQGRHQGLALPGAHLGDLALVQRHAADQLHVEVTHPQGALTGLAADREGLRQDPVETFALLQALAELVAFCRQGAVIQGLDLVGEGIDLAHNLAQAFQLPLIAGAEDFFHCIGDHVIGRRDIRNCPPG